MAPNINPAPNPTPEISVTTRNTADTSAAGEQLPARALRAFVARSAMVECLEGELWVTGPGIDDEVLERGESIVITKPGKVVVQALVAARMRVRESAA